MKNARVTLEVNGQEVPLNPFVSDFLRQTILGMISALKGAKSPRQIKLEIEVVKPKASKSKKRGSRPKTGT